MFMTFCRMNLLQVRQDKIRKDYCNHLCPPQRNVWLRLQGDQVREPEQKEAIAVRSQVLIIFDFRKFVGIWDYKTTYRNFNLYLTESVTMVLTEVNTGIPENFLMH